MVEVHLRVLCEDNVDTERKRDILNELRLLSEAAGEMTNVFEAKQTFRPSLSLGALEIVLVIVGTSVGLSLADYLASKLGVERPTGIIYRLLKQKSIRIEIEEDKEGRRILLEEKEGVGLKDNIKKSLSQLFCEDEDE